MYRLNYGYYLGDKIIWFCYGVTRFKDKIETLKYRCRNWVAPKEHRYICFCVEYLDRKEQIQRAIDEIKLEVVDVVEKEPYAPVNTQQVRELPVGFDTIDQYAECLLGAR